MRKKIIRHGQCLLNQIGCVSIFIVIAVVGKKERPVAFQAVIPTFVFFKGVERGRRHRRRDGLRGDFLLGRLHACGKGIDIRLIRLERDGRIGLLKAGGHLPARFVDGDGSLIGHLRQRLERAVHEAVERVFGEHAGLVRAGERTQRHVSHPVVLSGNRGCYACFRRRKDRAGQRAHHIAGCADGSREVRVNGAQRTEGVGQVEIGAVHPGGHGGGAVEHRPGHVKGYASRQRKAAVRVRDRQSSRGNGCLCLERGTDADAVVGVCVVVGVRPPAFGDGRGIDGHVFAVGQAHDVARPVLRAQSDAAAIVAGDRLGGAAVRKRQRQRDVAPGRGGQPVGDLLSVV